MSAPEGNNYWEFRNKHGRYYKYTPEELWNEAVRYFNWASKRFLYKKEAIKSGNLAGGIVDIPTNTPFSIESFCLYADIVKTTFYTYEKNNDFLDITARIRAIIENNQFEGATVGIYNPNIIARKLGLVDKTEQQQNIKVEGRVSIDPSKISKEAKREILKSIGKKED